MVHQAEVRVLADILLLLFMHQPALVRALNSANQVAAPVQVEALAVAEQVLVWAIRGREIQTADRGLMLSDNLISAHT